jgi:hypothetical protein
MMHRPVCHLSQLSVGLLEDIVKMSASVGQGLCLVYSRDVVTVVKPSLLGLLCEI